MSRRRKYLVWPIAVIACLAMFILANVFAGTAASNAEATRLAIREAESRGWQVTGTPSINTQDHIFGRTVIISLSTPQRYPQMWTTLEVTFRKPFNLMNWQFIDFQERRVVE